MHLLLAIRFSIALFNPAIWVVRLRWKERKKRVRCPVIQLALYKRWRKWIHHSEQYPYAQQWRPFPFYELHLACYCLREIILGRLWSNLGHVFETETADNLHGPLPEFHHQLRRWLHQINWRCELEGSVDISYHAPYEMVWAGSWFGMGFKLTDHSGYLD